jgi:hypothetical protein
MLQIGNMSSGTNLRNVAPASLAELAKSRDYTRFLLQYGHALLLAVQIGDDEMQLATGLDGASAKTVSRTSIPTGIRSMDFHTAQATPRHLLRRASEHSTSAEAELKLRLAKRIDEARQYVVALRKRGDSETLSADRISVGRATNKDIVLRHPSVSKFHAWFETDENDALYLTDAESKNATRLNGKTLSPRERTRVDAGDTIAFGTVDAVVCSPRTLWLVIAGGTADHT